MDDSEFLRRLRPSHVAGGGNLYRHMDEMEFVPATPQSIADLINEQQGKGGDKLIYNIIVNADPTPDGRHHEMFVVELEIDSNPQFKEFGQGVILRFDFPQDGTADWSIPAITAEVAQRMQADLEERTLEEARQLSAPLHEGITKAYVDQNDPGPISG